METEYKFEKDMKDHPVNYNIPVKSPKLGNVRLDFQVLISNLPILEVFATPKTVGSSADLTEKFIDQLPKLTQSSTSSTSSTKRSPILKTSSLDVTSSPALSDIYFPGSAVSFFSVALPFSSDSTFFHFSLKFLEPIPASFKTKIFYC
jgi:hypothetical protein